MKKDTDKKDKKSFFKWLGKVISGDKKPNVGEFARLVLDYYKVRKEFLEHCDRAIIEQARIAKMDEIRCKLMQNPSIDEEKRLIKEFNALF